MSKTIIKYIKRLKEPEGPFICEEPLYVFKTTLSQALRIVHNPIDMYRIKREYFDKLPNHPRDVYRALFIEAVEQQNPVKIIIWRILLWNYLVSSL